MLKKPVRWVACLLIASLASGPVFGQTADLFVDASVASGGNGATWQFAYQTVQEAIDKTNLLGTGDIHIAVAEATYKGSSETWGGTGQRNEVIRLKSSSNSGEVFLHGGFIGYNGGPPNVGTDQYNSPDGSYNNTILSGAATGTSSSNYHVLVADTATGILDAKVTVDGFKITGGEADGTGVNDDGAGIYCNDDAQVRLEYIEFADNQAAEDGGGVYDTTTGDTNLLEIKLCTFEDNSAKRGAGMFVFGCHDVKIMNADFHGNGDDTAGAGGFPPITTKGGAIFTGDETILQASNVLIDSNLAQKGGAVYIDPILCGNSTDSFLQHWRNCTFAQNQNPSTGSSLGAGFHVETVNSGSCADKTLWIYNCVFWAQSGGRDVYLESNTTADINYTDWDASTSGSGVGYTIDSFSITADPEFIDAPNHNFRLDLGQSSPCINAGSNALIGLDFLDLDRDTSFSDPLPYDLDLTTRVQDTTVDMGAYED